MQPPNDARTPTPCLTRRHSAEEFAALLGAARQDALHARREACQAFWTALAQALRSGWRRLRLSASAQRRGPVARRMQRPHKG